MARRLNRAAALASLILLCVARLTARALLGLASHRPKNIIKDKQMTDLPVTTAPAVDASQVVTSVADAVEAHPGVPASQAASVITTILAGLAEAQPAIFAVSRASARTQAQVSLGLGLAEVIVGALLKRAR